MYNKFYCEDGFTLFEIILVVGLAGTLLAITAPMLPDSFQLFKDVENVIDGDKSLRNLYSQLDKDIKSAYQVEVVSNEKIKIYQDPQKTEVITYEKTGDSFKRIDNKGNENTFLNSKLKTAHFSKTEESFGESVNLNLTAERDVNKTTKDYSTEASFSVYEKGSNYYNAQSDDADKQDELKKGSITLINDFNTNVTVKLNNSNQKTIPANSSVKYEELKAKLTGEPYQITANATDFQEKNYFINLLSNNRNMNVEIDLEPRPADLDIKLGHKATVTVGNRSETFNSGGVKTIEDITLNNLSENKKVVISANKRVSKEGNFNFNAGEVTQIDEVSNNLNGGDLADNDIELDWKDGKVVGQIVTEDDMDDVIYNPYPNDSATTLKIEQDTNSDGNVDIVYDTRNIQGGNNIEIDLPSDRDGIMYKFTFSADLYKDKVEDDWQITKKIKVNPAEVHNLGKHTFTTKDRNVKIRTTHACDIYITDQEVADSDEAKNNKSSIIDRANWLENNDYVKQGHLKVTRGDAGGFDHTEIFENVKTLIDGKNYWVVVYSEYRKPAVAELTKTINQSLIPTEYGTNSNPVNAGLLQ